MRDWLACLSGRRRGRVATPHPAPPASPAPPEPRLPEARSVPTAPEPPNAPEPTDGPAEEERPSSRDRDLPRPRPPAGDDACPYPVVTTRRLPDGAARRGRLLLSADVYLLPAEGSRAPRDARDFVGATRLALERLPDGAGMAQLDGIVRPADGCDGCGMIVVGDLRKKGNLRPTQGVEFLVVAPTRRLRDDWLGLLRIRLAPWSLLATEVLGALCPVDGAGSKRRDEVAEEEEEDGNLSPLLLALSESFAEDSPMVSVSTGAGAMQLSGVAVSSMQRSSPVSGNGGGAVSRRQRATVWTTEAVAQAARRSAAAGNWFGTFSCGAAALAGTADGLAKTLGGFALIGPVIGMVAVTSHAADMLCRMRTNQKVLADAHNQLRYISSRLCQDVVAVLESGMDDREFIGRMFEAVEECWSLMAEMERLLLDRSWERFHSVERGERLAAAINGVKVSLDHIRLARFCTDLYTRVGRIETEQLEREQGSPVSVLIERNRVVCIPELPSHFAVQAVRKREELLEAICSGGAPLRPVVRVSVQGSGGTGKTVALKYAAYHFAHQSDHFTSGVAWLNLGPDATPGSVCKELSTLWEQFDPSVNATELLAALPSTDDVDSAVQITKETLACHKLLLIVDGGWIRPSESKAASSLSSWEWADCLSDIVTLPGSCVLFSTRFDVLSESAHRVLRFNSFDMKSPVEREAAIALFDCYLYSDSERNDPACVASYDAKTRDAILGYTAGLQIAVANAGVFVRRHQWRFDEALDALVDAPEDLLEFESASTAGSLSRFLDLGLRNLDQNSSSSAKFLRDTEIDCLRDATGCTEKTFSILYASLSVLPKTAPLAPIHVVACVWGTKVPIARKVANLLESFGLLTLETCGPVSLVPLVDGTERTTRPKIVALHDLQYAHAQRLCRLLEVDGVPLSAAIIHGNLVARYCRDVLYQELSPAVDWSGVLPKLPHVVSTNDTYMRDNLMRHMEAAVGGLSGGLMFDCLTSLRKCIATKPEEHVAVLESLLRRLDMHRDGLERLAELDATTQGFTVEDIDQLEAVFRDFSVEVLNTSAALPGEIVLERIPAIGS